MSLTIVSGNLADIQGVTWTNAPIEITFVPNPSKPGPVIWTDGPFNPGPILIFSDINGNFSISLPSTTSIQPSNSTWLFSIGPNASAQAVLLNIPVTGATMNISTLFTARSNALLIQSLRVPRAYAAFELDEPTNMGQLFYNTTLGVFQFWTGTVWDTIVGTIQPPPANAIISDPTLAQSILQPPGTDFTIGVSGGGQFVVNGNSLLQGDLNVTGQITGELSVIAYGSRGIDVSASHVKIGTGLGAPNNALITLVNAAAAVDEKAWDIVVFPNQLIFTLDTDAGLEYAWLTVTRSTHIPTLAEFVPPVKLDSTLNVVGDSLFNGQVVSQMAVVAYGSRGTDITSNHVKIGTGLASGQPLIAIVSATSATDNKLWYIATNPTQLYFTTTSDAGQDHSWMIVTRNGGLATGIEFKPPVTFDSDVNITGNLLAANYPFLLTTSGNSGPSTLVNNAGVITLNIPQYTASGGGSVTQLIAGANIFIAPPGGTGVVTVSAASQVYPAAGIAVSSGSLWTTSIDPTTVPRTNVPNTFTGTPQSFNGQVNVGGSVVAVGGFVAGSIGGNSARMTVASSASVFDAFGVNPSTSGTFLFRTQHSDGSGLLNAVTIDALGDAFFNGTGSFGAAVALGVRAGNNWGAGIANINSDGTNIVINPAHGAFAVFFNFDQGTNGVQFCDGATHVVAHIDGAGNAFFDGTITAAGKTFLVPHPLIADKDLIHACLEGPENGVYYRGTVEITDFAVEVTLPDYFEALTFEEDRSVMLTQVFSGGDFAFLAASSIAGGRFFIHANVKTVKVMWEVKAIRRLGVDRLAVVRDKFVPKEVANA